MDFGPLHTLELDLHFRIHGVAATVTRPAPDDTTVTTTIVWMSEAQEERPFGATFQRRDPRRVIAIPRSDDLPTLPNGTVIVAPESSGADDKTWQVDGLERVEPDIWHAIVKLALS